MDFLKWYRNIINSAEEEPPDRVWEEIRNELDVDAVWTDIEKELTASDRKRRFFMMSAAASILLILASGALFYLITPDYSDKGFIIPADQITGVSLGPLKTGPSIQARPAAITKLPVIRNTLSATDETGLQISEAPSSAGEELQLLSYLEYQPEPVSYTIEALFPVNSLNGEKKGSGEPEVKNTGYFAGLSGHLANTWLMNNKTLQGLKPDEFTTSLPSFGYNLGVIAGKKISNKFDIQTEFYFVSLTRQNYNEYLHGQYIKNKMQFRYFNLSVSARWYLAETDSQGKHSLILGAYTGILNNAFQDLDGESISLSNEYNSTDYGIVTGYEYHHPVGNGLSIGTGFQTRFGLNNIFAGNELIPDYLNITRNASVNLTLSLRYN